MSSYLSLLEDIGSYNNHNDKNHSNQYENDKNGTNINELSVPDINDKVNHNNDDVNSTNDKNDNINGIDITLYNNICIEDLGYFGVYCLNDSPTNNNNTNDNGNDNTNNNTNDNDNTNDNHKSSDNNDKTTDEQLYDTYIDIKKYTHNVPEVDVWPSDDINLNDNRYEFITDYENNIANNTDNTNPTNVKFKKEIHLLCYKNNSVLEVTSSSYERNDRNSTISKISAQSILIADNVLKKVGVQASTAITVGEKIMTEIHKTIKNNKTILDATSCVNESFLFAMDRVHTASLYISQSLTADDPETVHWKSIRACSKDKWDSVWHHYHGANDNY